MRALNNWGYRPSWVMTMMHSPLDTETPRLVEDSLENLYQFLSLWPKEEQPIAAILVDSYLLQTIYSKEGTAEGLLKEVTKALHRECMHRATLKPSAVPFYPWEKLISEYRALAAFHPELIVWARDGFPIHQNNQIFHYMLQEMTNVSSAT